MTSRPSGPGAQRAAPARGARSRARAARRPRRRAGWRRPRRPPPAPASRSPRDELHLEPQPRRVAARDVERVLADVGGDDVEVRALVLQGERDRAAAGADVDDARPLRQPLDRRLDERLGLRPRDQHARVDVQLEVAEALHAGDVGDGLALAPRAGARRPGTRARPAPSTRASRSATQPRAIGPERVREQHLGVQRGVSTPAAVSATTAESSASRTGVPVMAPQACDSSRRRRSSSVSAAVKGSSSPSRTCSRLCSVSLMRWSVTRRSP